LALHAIVACLVGQQLIIDPPWYVARIYTVFPHISELMMKTDELTSNLPGLQLTRRSFLVAAAASGTVIASGALIATSAQAQTLVDETTAQAMALGYVADAKRADAKKFPRYADGQLCSSCALFQGKPGDAAGGCALFGASHVAAAGWCNAWSKKA
jgi:hypothetical protein